MSCLSLSLSLPIPLLSKIHLFPMLNFSTKLRYTTGFQWLTPCSVNASVTYFDKEFQLRRVKNKNTNAHKCMVIIQLKNYSSLLHPPLSNHKLAITNKLEKPARLFFYPKLKQYYQSWIIRHET